MKNVDNNELIRRIHENDETALEMLITQNEKLIWSIVHRFRGRYETEDLFQIGCIGMIKAARRFDLSLGLMFSTYAVPVVMGEIQKFLRDDGIVKVSRSIRSNALKIAAASEKYVQQNSVQPSVSVLCELTGLDREDVIEAVSACTKPLSIYSSDENERSLVDTIPACGSFDEEIADIMSVKAAAKTLSEREQKLINLRYFKNKTQQETATELSLSQAQVSRIEKAALEKMRAQLV